MEGDTGTTFTERELDEFVRFRTGEMNLDLIWDLIPFQKKAGFEAHLAVTGVLPDNLFFPHEAMRKFLDGSTPVLSTPSLPAGSKTFRSQQGDAGPP